MIVVPYSKKHPGQIWRFGAIRRGYFLLRGKGNPRALTAIET
jgi:hypothetical protein